MGGTFLNRGNQGGGGGGPKGKRKPLPNFYGREKDLKSPQNFFFFLINSTFFRIRGFGVFLVFFNVGFGGQGGGEFFRGPPPPKTLLFGLNFFYYFSPTVKIKVFWEGEEKFPQNKNIFF